VLFVVVSIRITLRVSFVRRFCCLASSVRKLSQMCFRTACTKSCLLSQLRIVVYKSKSLSLHVDSGSLPQCTSINSCMKVGSESSYDGSEWLANVLNSALS
jgi:hypothetical protein